MVEKDRKRRGKTGTNPTPSSPSHESAVLDANGTNGVTQARGLITTRRRAVRIAKALARDELRPIPLANVLRPRQIQIDGARARSCARTRSNCPLVDRPLARAGTRAGARTRTRTGPAEPAPLLSLREGNSGAGADAPAAEGGAAARGAVRVGEARARDELDALSVADVLGAGGVCGQGGGEGEDGYGDCGGLAGGGCWGGLLGGGAYGLGRLRWLRGGPCLAVVMVVDLGCR